MRSMPTSQRWNAASRREMRLIDAGIQQLSLNYSKESRGLDASNRQNAARRYDAPARGLDTALPRHAHPPSAGADAGAQCLGRHDPRRGRGSGTPPRHHAHLWPNASASARAPALAGDAVQQRGVKSFRRERTAPIVMARLDRASLSQRASAR